MSDRVSTRQRRLLLEILRETGSHLSAKELFRQAVQRDPRISLASVYRNLHLFEELGLVDGKRLDRNCCYYEVKRSRQHYDLVCNCCGRVTEFESPMIEKLVGEVQERTDFEVTKAVLYLEGYCKQCEGQSKKP